MSLLSVEDLSRSFGGLRALDKVSFGIEPGGIHGIVGPNGSGKTTLLNVVSKLLPPTSGRLFFDGREYTSRRSHEVAGLGIARTFQSIRLFSALTVLENVMLGHHARMPQAHLTATWLRLPAERRAERDSRHQALELLARLSIDRYAATSPHELPYGLQRRVEIARALAMEPRLLLLDEPTAGMPLQDSLQIGALLRDIAAQGITVVIVEHNLRLLMQLCDEMIVFSFGRKLVQGNPAEVMAHPEVITAYLGRAGQEVLAHGAS
jgi:ABC-type branched-subunit amino acid transport system ATPase component